MTKTLIATKAPRKSLISLGIGKMSGKRLLAGKSILNGKTLPSDTIGRKKAITKKTIYRKPYRFRLGTVALREIRKI